MSSRSPQDIETGHDQGPAEDEKTVIETDTTSSTTQSISHTNAQQIASDEPNIVDWDGKDDPESQSARLRCELAIDPLQIR